MLIVSIKLTWSREYIGWSVVVPNNHHYHMKKITVATLAKRYAANCIGNMTYQEAADLAGWCWTKCVIPAHYDMFAMNQEDPQLFLDYMAVKYPEIKTEKLDPGEIRILKMNHPVS